MSPENPNTASLALTVLGTVEADDKWVLGGEVKVIMQGVFRMENRHSGVERGSVSQEHSSNQNNLSSTKS